MKYDSDKHHRHSIRLKNFDYSSNGLYFITICTQDRALLFGDVVVGADSISAQVKLNCAGHMVERLWHDTFQAYSNVLSVKYVIMPNHMHCLIAILRADMESAPTVGEIVQSFKRNTTIKYIDGVKSDIYLPFNKRVWQRNYYEHIVRDEDEYARIWKYIDANPVNWQSDEYYDCSNENK